MASLSVCVQGNLPLEDVFELLSTSRGGLSSSDAAERLQLFGPNRLEEKRVRKPTFSRSSCAEGLRVLNASLPLLQLISGRRTRF